VPLNPMSVTLGALVIAISTEFSVLLSERYREERRRRRGLGSAEALAKTYRSTGMAVLASGATAIAGFAVLVVSDIRMLRDFGFVTVVDLTVSLLGVLLVRARRAAARRAPRTRADLSPAGPAAEPGATSRGAGRDRRTGVTRSGAAAPPRSDHRGQRAALALGHRADRLGLGHADDRQELAAARGPPPALAEQQLGDRHAGDLPRTLEDHRCDGRASLGDAALELGTGEPDLVGAPKCLHMLWRRGDRRCCVGHLSSCLPRRCWGSV